MTTSNHPTQSNRSRSPSVSPASNTTQTPMAYHLLGETVRELTALPPNPSAPALPKTLVIPPGPYTVHGQVYDATAEGLYRFIHPMHDNQQRIVHRHEVRALLSALCWMQSHGSREDYRSFEEILEVGLTRKLILTCGPFSNFATKLLGQLGIPIRTVCVKTLLDRNGFSDGHVLTEVQLDGRWVVFDADPHRLYTCGGRYLSLLDLIPHVQANDYVEEPLARSLRLAVGLFTDKEGKYDYSLWAETVDALPDRRQGFRRVMMVPVIPVPGEGSFYTTYSEADARRFQELWTDPGFHYLTEKEFRARFYPAA